MLPYYRPDVLEVGIDEAGRGSLIGDVYAAAVILPPEISFFVNDSKKLSRRRRLILKDCIEEEAIDFSVSAIDNESIDTINILNATMMAMHNAVHQLNTEPECIIVDGNYFKDYYNTKGENIRHICVVDGDSIYNSIAAASILAKVYHDQHIEQLCNDYPVLREYYKIDKNMGYGTQDHLDGIEKYGITQFHRRSYRPCKDKKLLDL